MHFPFQRNVMVVQKFSKLPPALKELTLTQVLHNKPKLLAKVQERAQLGAHHLSVLASAVQTELIDALGYRRAPSPAECSMLASHLLNDNRDIFVSRISGEGFCGKYDFL